MDRRNPCGNTLSSKRRFDWRRLPWRLAPLGCGLFLGMGIGCAHDGPLSITGETPAVARAKDEENLPKRLPKASTCVALGNLRLKAATGDPPCPPEQRELVLDQARRAFEKAIEIDPKCIEGYKGLADTYQAQENHARAVDTYHRCLKMFPKDSTLWFGLGMCQARNKEWEPALECLRTAVSLDPESRTCNNMLGYCLARTGHFDESFTVFEKLGGAAQAHYNLARMLHHMHQDEPSKQHLLLALRAKPAFPKAQKLLDELEEAAAAAAQPTAPAYPPRPTASAQPAPTSPAKSAGPSVVVGFDGLDDDTQPAEGVAGTAIISPTGN